MEETRQKAPGNRHFPAVLRFVAALLLSETLCLAWGGGNVSAQIRSIYVTVDATDASIREVLESIESQSDLRFVYPDEVKPILTKVVTVREKNVSANRILDQILPDVGLQYSVGGTQVRIYQAASGSRDVAQTVSGTVISSNLVDYLAVTPGQILVRIDGEDSETEIFTAQQNLEEAQKKLEAAQKNLDNCNAVAPISGQVIGLSVTPGQELQANSTLVTVSDTSTVTVSATVDERNISYIKTGMPVNLDQWGTSAFGTVETVSLSSTVNNGVASYPITISADNTDGNLQVNSYVNYQIQASQNDNCLMVPIQAVRTVGLEDGSSATVVYVQADSRPDNALELPYQDEEIPSGFYPVQVEIGIQDTYNVEIKSGVNDGDTVFTQMITDQAWG